MDPSQTPPPSPGVSQAHTPGRHLDNEYRPGLRRTSGPEFYAQGHHLVNENSTPPPGPRRMGPEHNTEGWHEMPWFTPEEGMVGSPSADPPPLSLGRGHLTSPELNITPMEMLHSLADDQRYRIRDLNQVIANNQAELARAERRLGELVQFIRVQGNLNRRHSGRTSPLSNVTTPEMPVVTTPVRPVDTTPVRPVPRIRGPPPIRRRVRIESGSTNTPPRQRWDQNGTKLWLQQTNTPLKL
jgi:hypothetical protein